MTRTHIFVYAMIGLFLCQTSFALNDNTRVAFYYGNNPPLDELHAFNVVVVEPQNDLDPKQYNNAYSELYAYVHIGEMDAHANYIKRIPAAWRKGKNPAWDSHIMDLANPGWRDFLLNDVFKPLWESGYRGFFLDTLDSYELLKLTPQQKQQQRAGIVDIIKRVKSKYPKAKIITNRGFEVLDAVHQDVDAVAAESLFAGWNPQKKQYQAVSKNDREWLTGKLETIRRDYHLPVIVIDYLPIDRRDEARKVARKISASGFIPWVTDWDLQSLGVGTVEVIPRKILLLYEKNAENAKNPATAIAAFAYSAFPLQFMGFIPVLQPVDETLPQGVLKDRYAGILTWFNQPVIKNHKRLEKWLTQQIQQGIPVVFMQNFGVPLNSPLFKRLNITVRENSKHISKIRIKYRDESIGYEALPQPIPVDFLGVTCKNGQVLLQVQADDLLEDVIVVTPWGGYALTPYDIVVLPDSGQSRWVVNPFEFFRKTLKLPEFPVPDVTTASGRRILNIHIDGDAFISRIPWMHGKFTAEVILEQILNRYKLPTGVSIIQREFEIIKSTPNIARRLTKVARRIFALPWVEIATHTYSHPLDWANLKEGQPNTEYLSYPDKNYHFSFQKEITGSVAFINKFLAPSDKKVTAIYWSGNSNPLEKPLKIAYQAGLMNINGMAKIYINSTKSITNLGPLGINTGKFIQVFAPIPNEFEYTDNWAPPYYAFQNAIHTFELTDKPVRYKPISIYYHFYAAVDQASLRALKRIYKWTVRQLVIPLQVTDYIHKVLDFNNTVIAKNITDDTSLAWLIVNNKSLREFRWPIGQGVPDLAKSRNVAGYSAINNDYYIHTGNACDTWIRFTSTPPTEPYLVDANAEITHWHRINKDTFQLSLKGYVPLDFKLANMNQCLLKHNNHVLQTAADNNYSLKDAHCGTFEIHCTR
ncbi:bifunctional glycoside hydrolase 114/ polysaccharide deacetylase family protein [Legionella spiritensis]|uniref:Glycoside-hydrolase family GH114 TIM-barrel domain-containing protein n=1 Tax=Legionella spiritensis TaxID=452 RepID=A0A0W0YXR3_LEGSP|nr:endo alpha-1,4 polygalactosaminidase [Legionella spiritensis]KTD61690.1 hypothetical protein Lspi_2320 [Legionella spiritensis]SNV38925.1 Uncharacterized conserved protein [Legionella spiritensis]